MRTRNKLIIFILLVMMLLTSVSCTNSSKTSDVVTLYGWGGDPRVNDWIDNELAAYVKENYGIKLERVPMNIDEILTKLTNEKGSDKTGSIDVIWINGENFYYAKQNELLYGPFIDKIENAAKYIDMQAASTDFGYPTDGYEAPWGNAQFVFVNNSNMLANPPQNSDELKSFVMSNPGVFTYPEATDFVGSAFIRTVIYDIIGYENVKDLTADYDTVKSAIMPAMNYLNEIKPYLWKEGKTYPKDSAQLDGLYQDEEVYIAMDYNANKALSKVSDGSWDSSTKTFVWEKGTPFNTHFLAIAANAPNKEAAMKLINAALSPAMQISKANLEKWADMPVLDYTKLSDEDKASLDKTLTPSEELKDSILAYGDLTKNKQPEIKADLVTIIEKIWEEVVLFEKQ